MDNKEIKFKRKEKKSHEPAPKFKKVLNLLYMLLKKENKSAEHYAEILNCKPRTIKKYIHDITYTYDPYEEYKIFEIDYNRAQNHYKLTTLKDVFVKCTHEEVIALYFAMKYLSGMEGTPLMHLSNLEKKLRKYYHESVKPKLKKPVQLSGPEIKSKLEEMLQYIDEAMIGKEKKKIIINYTKTYYKEPERKELVPFSLLVHDYDWYLKAFCLKTKMMKNYVINQMEIIETQELNKEERNIIPEKPDLFISHNWDWANEGENIKPVQVKIKFTGKIAYKFKNKLAFRKEHPSQEWEEQEEFIIVKYRVKAPFNMTPWILKSGSFAEVLEPKILREHIKEEVNKLKALYE